MQNQEEWRMVPGYPNYLVSNMGRAQSNLLKGNMGRTCDWHLLSPGKTSAGYPTMHVSRNKRATTVYVHVLVLEAFIGPRSAGMVACHENGIRDDNRLANLRWDTRKNNELDKISHGTWNKGRPKLNNQQVDEIRLLLVEENITQSEIARRFGVSPQTICNIKKGRVWFDDGGAA